MVFGILGMREKEKGERGKGKGEREKEKVWYYKQL